MRFSGGATSRTGYTRFARTVGILLLAGYLALTAGLVIGTTLGISLENKQAIRLLQSHGFPAGEYAVLFYHGRAFPFDGPFTEGECADAIRYARDQIDHTPDIRDARHMALRCVTVP